MQAKDKIRLFKTSPRLEMDETLLLRFRALIAAQTGIQIPERELATLRRATRERAQALRQPSDEAYYRWLECHVAENHPEWHELATRLTTGETYFFRDPGQFSLIKHRLLPQLIARRRDERRLRLWSAGCSTGEEVYSLAIVLDELLPESDAWDILLLGTDINAAAIEQARRGVYREWSFRATSAELRERCFLQHRDGWEIMERFRRRVTFRLGDVIKDDFLAPASGLHDLDLILCRNVFIYFTQETVSAVMPKLAAALAAGGYLITGHGEASGAEREGLKAYLFPESVAYQRPPLEEGRKAQKPGLQPPVPQPVPRPRVEPPPLYSPGPAPPPAALVDWLQGALAAVRQFADRGEYEQADVQCRLIARREPLAAEPYYLLAQLAEARGAHGEAEAMLKRVIYLAPMHIAAHLDLGALHERRGDAERGRRARATACELLAALPADARVLPYDHTAAELLRQIRETAEKQPSPESY